MVRRLGADGAIIGEVQKVSNLILNLNACVQPISRRAPERDYRVDLRGRHRRFVRRRSPLSGREQ
jgi:hypothetical protein